MTQLDRLKRGIRIFLDNDIDSTNRLQVSAGLKTADMGYSIQYYDSAIVPSEPWQDIDDGIKKLLLTDDYTNYSKTISVISIPESLKQEVAQLNLAEIKNDQDLKDLYKRQEYFAVTHRLQHYLLQYQWKAGRYHVNPIIFNKNNLYTSTYDENTGVFVGMHIDSWDRTSLNSRYRNSNRICLNIGLDDRYLLFINLTVKQVLNIVKDRYLAEKADDTTLLEKFFELHPSYPVFKLRLSPGEAYIAPTENMIHDGSTWGSRHVDLQLTIRGYFNFKPNNK